MMHDPVPEPSRRQPPNPIVDRPRRAAALAVGAAWLAYMVGLLAGGDLEDVVSFALAAVIGAALVVAGFVAASHCRPLPRTEHGDRARLALLSLAAGTALGAANLAANWMIAEADPKLRTLLVERMMSLGPLDALVAAPLVEEVLVRLFLMSGLAWVIFRLTKRPALAFAVGLVGSALVFGLLHLARPFPGDPALANFYRGALLTKYTLGGLPLGWIFWRWGLPYAILCHVAVNATHLVLQRAVF